jgi:type IV pilus assembly protein PilB
VRDTPKERRSSPERERARAGRIGEILVSRGMLSREQLRVALSLEKKDHRRLAGILLSQNLVSGEDLAQGVAEATGFEYVSLSEGSVDSEALSLLDEKVLRKHAALPLRVEGGRLVLAMSDPTDILALDDLKTLAGCSVRPVVATGESIRNLQERVFGTGEEIPEFLETDEGPVRPQTENTLSISRADDEGAPAVRLANSIIRRALSEGASDIHIEPRAEELVVRYRVDGVLRRGIDVPLRLKDSLTSRFKIMGDLDISMSFPSY